MNTETPVERVLGKLHGVTGREPQWSARCPAHDDKRASLSVGEKPDGQVLLTCQTGCTFEDVLGALSMRAAELFPSNPSYNGKNGSTGHMDEVASYTYTDEQGKNLFQKRRYLPKSFLLFRWENGEWKAKLETVRRVLYRLPEVVAAAQAGRIVFLVEGEKDADNLAALGFCTTTNYEGASKDTQKPKWREDYSKSLRGAKLVVIPDNDDAGRAHALNAARVSHPYAESVRILGLPGVPDKGDVSDWLASGGDADKLKKLVADTPPWTPPTTLTAVNTSATLAVRDASTITPKRIAWRWRLRLSVGRYHEIVGFPGIGKTALVMDMIGRLTTGDGWPDGDPCEATDVLIVAAEDEAEDVLVPRLLAAGAALKRVHFVDGIKRGEHIEELDLSRAFDFAEVRRLVTEKNAGLIYLDALDDVLGGNHDGKGNAETRRALAPIRQLARQTGATVLGLRHPTKRVALGPALNNGNGSIAYGAVCRGSMLVTVDPNDPDTRLLLATKSNISRLAPTLRFKLVGERDDDPPKISWESGTDNRTADDVLAALRTKEQENPNDTQEELSKVEQAMELLREWLKDGWLTVPEVTSRASQQDVSPKTLRRAKENLGLKYQRAGFGKNGVTFCGLPGVPYTPTPREVGKHGETETAPSPQPLTGEPDAAGIHARPPHARPSEKTAPWASTQVEQGDAWEPGTAA